MKAGKAVQVTILIVTAFLFGGGGSGAAIFNLTVQLVALVLVALNPQAVCDFFRQAPRLFALLVGASILLPLLQSIPLAPSIWRHLPGRDLAWESLNLLNRNEAWFPVSLNVRRTIIAFFGLMPPFAILVLAWKLPEATKRRFLLLIVAGGVFVVMLGAQQLVTGNQKLILFAETFGSTDLQGTFSNRNAAGLFLDVALCALIGLFPNRKPDLARLMGGVGVGILLVIGLVLTRSRSSMGLAMVPFALFMIQVLRSRLLDRMSMKTMVAAALGIMVLVAGTAVLTHTNQRVQFSLSRFDDLQDARPFIWADTMSSINRYWPIGSGVGTFDEVFQVDETLEHLGVGRAGRAHNDYLEVALESGIFGIALIIGWAAFLLRESYLAARLEGSTLVSFAVLSVLALQSVLDYPLRNQTLLCVAGLMLALSIRPPAAFEDPKSIFRRRDIGH